MNEEEKRLEEIIAEKDREIAKWKKIDSTHLEWDKDLQEQRDAAEADRNHWKGQWDIAVHEGMRWKARAEKLEKWYRDLCGGRFGALHPAPDPEVKLEITDVGNGGNGLF